MISADRVLQTLQRGVATAATAVDSYSSASPVADRLRDINELSRSITWRKTAGQNIILAQDATRTSIQVVAISTNDTVPGLSGQSNWQTQEDVDGETRVYVDRDPYTTLWAGIVLFHELSHVLDHRDGTWATEGDWWASEGRAYQLEAVLIDAITEGKFLPALRELVVSETESALFTTKQGLRQAASNLYHDTFPAKLKIPPAGPQEKGTREAALIFPIALASWAAPREIAEFTDVSDASPTLKRFAEILELL